MHPLNCIQDSRLQVLLLCCRIASARCRLATTLICDFAARQKVGVTNVKLFIVRQIPVLPPNAYRQAAIDFFQPRVL
jgi:hypothetical protein